jgi:hypothetical protein
MFSPHDSDFVHHIPGGQQNLFAALPAPELAIEAAIVDRPRTQDTRHASGTITHG